MQKYPKLKMYIVHAPHIKQLFAYAHGIWYTHRNVKHTKNGYTYSHKTECVITDIHKWSVSSLQKLSQVE